MLVIKMLKKASNMNNIELAEYLGKTRNTIASWENDENNIPNTEKTKLSNRFEFDYDYWNVGLDETTAFYQKMYSDIKSGYLKDSKNKNLSDESRIDEILKNCDATDNMVDHYREFDESNEYNHYQYINSLLEGIDPIDESKLDKNHFIYEYKFSFKDFDKVASKFNLVNKKEDINIDAYDSYLLILKDWRKKQANYEGVKPFQILSDEVLKNIVKAYKSGNKDLLGIKNFPVNGVKWKKYYEIIVVTLGIV